MNDEKLQVGRGLYTAAHDLFTIRYFFPTTRVAAHGSFSSPQSIYSIESDSFRAPSLFTRFRLLARRLNLVGFPRGFSDVVGTSAKTKVKTSDDSQSSIAFWRGRSRPVRMQLNAAQCRSATHTGHEATRVSVDHSQTRYARSGLDHTHYDYVRQAPAKSQNQTPSVIAPNQDLAMCPVFSMLHAV